MSVVIRNGRRLGAVGKAVCSFVHTSQHSLGMLLKLATLPAPLFTLPCFVRNSTELQYSKSQFCCSGSRLSSSVPLSAAVTWRCRFVASCLAAAVPACLGARAFSSGAVESGGCAAGKVVAHTLDLTTGADGMDAGETAAAVTGGRRLIVSASWRSTSGVRSPVGVCGPGETSPRAAIAAPLLANSSCTPAAESDSAPAPVAFTGPVAGKMLGESGSMATSRSEMGSVKFGKREKEPTVSGTSSGTSSCRSSSDTWVNCITCISMP
jgi:hypothetical protein